MGWVSFVLATALEDAPQAERVRAVAVEVTDNPCVQAATVHAGLGKTLQLPIAAPESSDDPTAATALHVTIAVRTRGYDVAVQVHDRTHELRRTLVVEDTACAELEAAIVLVGALLLDDLWSTQQIVHVQTPRDRTPAPELPVRPHPPAVRAPPSSEHSASWAVRANASARLAVGDLPGPAGGVALEWLATAPRVVSFGVQLSAWPYRRIDQARFSAVDFALPLCADALRRHIWALAICGAPRAGLSIASGVDLPTRHAAVRPRLLIDATLDVRVRLVGVLWLRGHIGFGVPIVRDRFLVGGVAPSDANRVIHRAWPVVPLFGLGLEVRAAIAGRRS